MYFLKVLLSYYLVRLDLDRNRGRVEADSQIRIGGLRELDHFADVLGTSRVREDATCAAVQGGVGTGHRVGSRGVILRCPLERWAANDRESAVCDGDIVVVVEEVLAEKLVVRSRQREGVRDIDGLTIRDSA